MYYSRFCLLTVFIVIVSFATATDSKENKCDIPPSAPKKIEEVINQCQDEIKLAILSEALEALTINEHSKSRRKRAAFTDDEKRIAGCLLQCVYKKMNAVSRGLNIEHKDKQNTWNIY